MFQGVFRVIPKPLVYTGVLAIAGILLTRLVFPYTAPFVLALVLAVIIDPTVDFLHRQLKMHRGFTVFIVLLLLFSLVVVFGANLLLRAVSELQDFVISAQGFPVLDFNEFDSWLQSYRAIQEYVPANISAVFEDTIYDLNRSITVTARSLLNFVINVVKDIPKLFIYTLVTFIATFFMSKDKDKIESSLLSLLPNHQRKRAIQIRRGVIAGAMGYVRAQLIIVSVTALIATISFLLLETPYVWFFAILVFVLDFIPVIGPSFVFVPWAGWAIFNGDIRLGLAFLLTYACIAASRQVLEPKLIGDRIGVHPLLTLFSLFVGVRLLGVAGFVVAPLLVISIKAILFTADELQTT